MTTATPETDPQAAKAANLDAIRAMLAAGPKVGDHAPPHTVSAVACREATAHAVPEKVVFFRSSLHSWACDGPRWQVFLAHPSHFSLVGRAASSVVGPLGLQLNRAPAVGTRWRHYKGGAYEVVAVGVHVETFEPMVAYRSDEVGFTWARTLLDWSAAVDLPGGGLARRFTPLVEGPTDPSGSEVRVEVPDNPDFDLGDHCRQVSAPGLKDYVLVRVDQLRPVAEAGAGPGPTTPEFPYEAFIAECDEGERTFGRDVLPVGEPITVVGTTTLGPSQEPRLLFQAGDIHRGLIPPGLVTRARPAPPAPAAEPAQVHGSPGAVDVAQGPYGRLLDTLGIDAAAFLGTPGDDPERRLEATRGLATAALAAIEAARTPAVPWVPRPGDRYRTHEGAIYTVTGAAHVPGLGLAVLHDHIDRTGRKHDATHGATSLKDWHAVVHVGKHAVRRFTPIPGQAQEAHPDG